MANLIIDKYISLSNTGKSFACSFKASQKTENIDEKSKKSDIIPNSLNKEQKYISAGLITGGALLLYYGLTRPSKAKLFDRYIKNRIFDMEVIANKFRTFVQDTIASSFKETEEHIIEFKKAYFLNPNDSIVQLKMFTGPQKIIYAQDMAFDAILNSNRARRKSGASEYGVFANKFSDIIRRVSGDIDGEKNRVMLELDDYLHLPKIKENLSADQLEEAESRLINASCSLDMYMSEFKAVRLNDVIKHQHAQMADAIIYSRKLQNITKQTIINSSFERIKNILGLNNDFIPLYNKSSYDLPLFDEISQYLVPQKIPQRIRKQTEPNVYMEALLKRDLRELSDKDLKEILFSIPYENNLKDLKYLIDRYRLKHAVALSSESKDASIYEGIIIKLEYLFNKLNAYGNDLLISRCDNDFSKMSIPERKAALYYIACIARRLGYESLDAMDSELYKNNEVYKNFQLHSSMSIIKENPVLYFVE